MSRTPGSIVEYSLERADALMEEYSRYVKSNPHIVLSRACEHIVNQPCPRFWVSPLRAAVVVAALIRGKSISGMRPSKQEMFREIFSRVMRLRESEPRAPLYRLVAQVVESPAPKFYLSPGSAKVMICKARKRWFRKFFPARSRS